MHVPCRSPTSAAPATSTSCARGRRRRAEDLGRRARGDGDRRAARGRRAAAAGDAPPDGALLRAAGASVREVRITRLAEHDLLRRHRARRRHRVDARPSDGIVLALVDRASRCSSTPTCSTRPSGDRSGPTSAPRRRVDRRPRACSPTRRRRARVSRRVRTSLPRTWPSSRRSCASAARSSGNVSCDVRAQAALVDQRRDVLAEVVAARAHEDVVGLVGRRAAPAAGGRSRRAGRRGAARRTPARARRRRRGRTRRRRRRRRQLAHARGDVPVVVVERLGPELAQEVVVALGRGGDHARAARDARAGSRGGRRRRRRRRRTASRRRAGRAPRAHWCAVSAASGSAAASSNDSSARHVREEALGRRRVLGVGAVLAGGGGGSSRRPRRRA